MTFSAFGTAREKAWIVLFNKLTDSTLPLNSPPKYQRTKLLSLSLIRTVVFKRERITKESERQNLLQAGRNL